MKEKFVITIGRQLGGGGRLIADELGKRFGIRVYNKEIINEAAKQSGLHPSFFERADEQSPQLFPLGTAAGLSADNFAASLSAGYINNDTLFGIQSETIRNLADKESCIFVGRCADYVLREHENILNVFITADLDDRIDRVAKALQCSDKEARNYITQTEKKRSAYYNYYSFKAWGAAESYDLCLNTSLLGIEKTAGFIADFAEAKLK